MITLLLKKLHASESTKLIVEEEWRVKVASNVNFFVTTSNSPQFKLLKSHLPEHLFFAVMGLSLMILFPGNKIPTSLQALYQWSPQYGV